MDESQTIPPSPTPISSAPPPTPSDPIQLDTAVASRQILQPVPPFKRAFPLAAHEDTGEAVENATQYIPKELAEIAAIRQRREQAWHARFLICTTIISSIDSTLVNFKDDVSKDEATAIQMLCQVPRSGLD